MTPSCDLGLVCAAGRRPDQSKWRRGGRVGLKDTEKPISRTWDEIGLASKELLSYNSSAETKAQKKPTASNGNLHSTGLSEHPYRLGKC